MNLSLRALKLVILILVIVCGSSIVMAQAVSGDLVGAVKDATGAVVASAQIELVNLATGQKVSSNANANGEFRFSNLPIGTYRLTATGAGLSAKMDGVKVELNRTLTVNVVAMVEAAATSVDVTQQAVSVDTVTATIQNSYDEKQSQDLPSASVGLGVLNLSLLQAGVASTGGVGAGTGPAVSGQRPRNNNFTIEGVDNNSKSVTGPLATVPNDAVSSFTVLQNNFSVEFGHSSGGQFNTAILSGSNKFHGRAYEYFQNRKLNAQDSQVARNQADPTNLRFDNNRFGGQIGGPILKDRLFFFTNWEYNPIGAVGGASTAYAPTSAGYTTLSALPGISANNLSILKQYLPAAGSRLKDLVVAGVPIPVGEIGFAGPNFTNNLTTANSVDLNLRQNDQIRFRYVYVKTTFSDTAAQLPDFWQSLPAKTHFGSLAEYHTFSPSLANEFRLGFNRLQQIYDVGPQQFPGLAMFPNITINDLNGVNIGPDPNSPQGGNQNTYQVVDNISWMKGKHNLKFGFEARKMISPQFFTQRVRGDYFYDVCNATDCPAANGGPSASGLDEYLRDLRPSNGGERSTGNPLFAGDQYALYGFANDEFRMTSQLTVTLGLRYEFTQTPAGTGLQALNSISDAPGLITFARPKAQKKNFMPRVGFAYSPSKSGDTSIRGGFAMAVDVIYDNLPLLSLPPQLSGTCDVWSPSATCTYSDTGFLANGGLPAGSTGITQFATTAEARNATAAFMPDQKLPYSEAWNIGVQHVFAKKYIAEVRYVGTKGIHLPVQARLNRGIKVTPSLYLPTYFTDPGQAALDASTVTYSQIAANSNYLSNWSSEGFDGASVVGFMPFGSSIYHGLQSQLTRNFTDGLQFQAAWTWSHMMDNSTADVFTTVLTPRRAQDWNNFAGERSDSALDHRHRITIQAIYDVPFFKKDKNWLLKNVIGNWEFAPIYTFQTPEYATVQSGVDSNLNGDAAGDRSIINPSGNRSLSTGVTALCNSAYLTSAAALNGAACGGSVTVGPTTYTTSAYIVGYLANNPNAYYVRAGQGALATARRNTLQMPRINNWDMTLVKRAGIREGMTMEFQAQFLNVFNHAQYVPGSLNQINQVGYVSGAATQMLTTGSSTFGDPKEVFSNNPRALQLVLKFIF
jgi:hypothetical protein